MIEKLADKIARRGFPVAIAVTRESAYGPSSARLVYPDELTPEEAAEYARQDREDLAARIAARGGASPLPSEPESPSAEISSDAPADPPVVPASVEIVPPEPAAPLPASILSLDLADPSLPPDFSRHARRCIICSHPDRDAIEGDFIRWTSPSQIAKTYKLADRASVYRHAHSTGLFDRRKREVGRVLENILENAEQCPAENFDTIIRAARLYTHLDNAGTWVEPPRITYFIAGPPPGSAVAVAPAPRKSKSRSSKTKQFLTATRPHSKIVVIN